METITNGIKAGKCDTCGVIAMQVYGSIVHLPGQERIALIHAPGGVMPEDKPAVSDGDLLAAWLREHPGYCVNWNVVDCRWYIERIGEVKAEICGKTIPELIADANAKLHPPAPELSEDELLLKIAKEAASHSSSLAIGYEVVGKSHILRRFDTWEFHAPDDSARLGGTLAECWAAYLAWVEGH